MHKKQRFPRLCAGFRAGALAAFCLALTLVLSPMERGALPVSGAAVISPAVGEPAAEQASLPQIGDALIPLGRTTGIKLFSPGTMVVGFSPLECAGCCPAKEGGLKAGDVLLALNGQAIQSNEDLTRQMRALEQEQAVFTVLRESARQEITVNAVYDPALQCYRIGAWVRDSVAGIGTVTFVDPETGVFGALGHGICDSDTGLLIPFGCGSVMRSSVDRVQKGASGTPGQLCGSFDLVRDQGWLGGNTESGIFGRFTRPEAYQDLQPVPTAARSEIHTGPAVIRSNVDGTETQEYTVEILRVYPKDSGVGRDLMLQVTDPQLLSATGGIVQGMSGSPILQDGKLVGAVTHVLVNDPTRGYGISLEEMLENAPAA